MTKVRDTSKDYDDMVEFKARPVKSDLTEVFEIDDDDDRELPVKITDPNFPEQWQNLYVSLRSEEDYIAFMKRIDEAPLPNTKSIVFTRVKSKGLLGFLED